MFGQPCLRLASTSKPAAEPGVRAFAFLGIGTLCAVSFFLYVLRKLRCENAMEGTMWGLAFGLFFDTGLNASHSFFEKQPFALSLIHKGCHAVGFASIGCVLGALCGQAVI